VRLGAFFGFALVLLATASGAADGYRAAAPQLRVLYASDWSGPMQIFAADPSGRTPVRQLTFDRPASNCWPRAVACGYTRPQPSPDGRWLAYWGIDPQTLWLARADGTGARAVAIAVFAAWTPDSRRLAYSANDGIHVLSMSGADRVVDKRRPDTVRAGLHWSPDGRTLAFVAGGFNDVRALVLLRDGHERVFIGGSLGPFAWAPDGRRIAYWDQSGLWIASTVTHQARQVYRLKSYPSELFKLELAFSPNGRLLAFTPKFSNEYDEGNGEVATKVISLLDLRTLRVRALRAAGHDLAWAPDGSSLLYVQGGENYNGVAITTGDVQTVTPSGRIRTVASATAPFGGQIVAAAWVTPPRGVHYRPPQPVDGVFAGGPVKELAADGSRVAFLACGGVWAFSTATGSIAAVERRHVCRHPNGYHTLYSLALAGDRLVWVDRHGYSGQGFEAKQATLGSAPVVIRHFTGAGGTIPPDGIGTATGAGSLLVMSTWMVGWTGGVYHVAQQTIVRVEPDGTLTPVSTTPGPYTVLDVDGGRIVASGTNETRILDTDGAVLLSLPVPTLAAQLSGSNLVLAAGDQLRVYDAATGAPRASWPLPAQPVGQHCSASDDPYCWANMKSIRLTLDDLARGLAAYVFDGQVHLLRLADGADWTVGPGTFARFTDSGLAFADGARIHLVPFEGLPLH
jgi:Tol biopolymer transport system component